MQKQIHINVIKIIKKIHTHYITQTTSVCSVLDRDCTKDQLQSNGNNEKRHSIMQFILFLQNNMQTDKKIVLQYKRRFTQICHVNHFS